MKLKNNSKAMVSLQNDQLSFSITLAPGELKEIDIIHTPFLSQYLIDMSLELVDDSKKVEPKVVEKKAEVKPEPKPEPKVEEKAFVNTNFSEEELNALTKAQIYEIIEKSVVKAPEGDKSDLIKFIMSSPKVVKIKK